MVDIEIDNDYWYTETAPNGVKLSMRVTVIGEKECNEGVGYEFKHWGERAIGYTIYPKKLTPYGKD